MEIELKQNPMEFLETSREFLERKEAENGLIIGLIERFGPIQAKSQSFQAILSESDEVDLVGFYSGTNIVLSTGNAKGLPLICEKLLEVKIDPDGVVGPDALSEEFSKHWVAARGCSISGDVRNRLYRLDKVIFPQNVFGRLREAKVADYDILVEWMWGFACEAVPHEKRSREYIEADAKKRIGDGFLHLWEVDGKPVAMANFARPTRKGMTINYVYTPKEFRGRGYASAITAWLSDLALKRGKSFCILFTDLANPTSNSIYQKVGYQPIMDSRHFIFKY